MDSSKTVWKGYHTMQRSNSSWQDVTEILPYVHTYSASSLPHPPSSFHPLPTFSANSTPLGKPPTKCTHAIPKHIWFYLTRTVEMATFMKYSWRSQCETYRIFTGWVKQSQTKNLVFAMVSPYGPWHHVLRWRYCINTGLGQKVQEPSGEEK